MSYMSNKSYTAELCAPRERGSVLGIKIDAVSWEDSINRLLTWGEKRLSAYVCICNVHSIITAQQDSTFAKVIEDADMATPDGAPVAWTLRRNGYPTQRRINGPDLMYMGEAEKRGQSVFFYGSTESTLSLLREQLMKNFPDLKIAGMLSPPFKVLTNEEDQYYVNQINSSGANVVFVGLGCPKQELWMADHRGKINAVMVGVGAAFDYHAGTISRAPKWMRKRGLEWSHRLASEPKRLWKRYLQTNSIFIAKTIISSFKKR
jgi:N-acetylglucosaminyldiphosphoundecaprenol N-acetyl-beta-D-mannosaminyltransferase